jgi:hypothetical protein
MAEKFINKRNLMFLLDEVFDVESLRKYPRYTDDSLKKNVGVER